MYLQPVLDQHVADQPQLVLTRLSSDNQTCPRITTPDYTTVTCLKYTVDVLLLKLRLRNGRFFDLLNFIVSFRLQLQWCSKNTWSIFLHAHPQDLNIFLWTRFPSASYWKREKNPNNVLYHWVQRSPSVKHMNQVDQKMKAKDVEIRCPSEYFCVWWKRSSKIIFT